MQGNETTQGNGANLELNETQQGSLGFSAYTTAASILIGAILISASIFYNTKVITKQLTGGSIIQTGQAGGQQAGGQQAPTGPVKIDLKANVPFLGNKDAKVTLVEFADYQCPFCEKFFTDTMSELKAKYIDTGKIKFVYQDFAFLGADSTAAAEATHCAADQNKFWQFHDYLFKNQGQENSGWAAAANQKKFAKDLGLDTTKFNQCMDSHLYQKEVQAETAAGKKYGVSGTPSVFVNGKIFVGAQPASAFVQAIEEGLK